MDWLGIIWSAFLDVTGITAWLHNREQQKIGEQKQQNADLKADLAVQQRVNAAEANLLDTQGTTGAWQVKSRHTYAAPPIAPGITARNGISSANRARCASRTSIVIANGR